MQICSLLPSATEILYALRLGDSVAGVTHECDFPPEAGEKPVLIRPRVNPHGSPREIDGQVGELVSRGESIYSVDAQLLESLGPDLIITQELCHVCAASPDDLAAALGRLPKQPQVLSLSPHSLEDVWRDIRRVGDATGTGEAAEALAADRAAKVAAIAVTAGQASSRPRVACLEWLDPFYVGGHWVPEMVRAAGGDDVQGRAGEPSFRVTAETIVNSQPEIIIIMPCGYSAVRAAAEFRAMALPESWAGLPALRERRIFAVDANSYFSRPGPRLAEGVKFLAHLLHPGLFPMSVPEDVFEAI